MATVVLLGTLDTKGVEYEYLRERIQATGCEVILVDAGIKDTPYQRQASLASHLEVVPAYQWSQPGRTFPRGRSNQPDP